MIQEPLLFLTAAIVLNISPGPDQAYILGRTLSQGRLVGLFSTWGVCSGAMIHVLAAALGFSVIIQTSEIAYNILLYCGAAYLLWLGITTLRSKDIFSPKNSSHKASKTRAYFQGVLVDILNPKVALFFLAFVPQFISPDDSHRFLTFVSLGTVVVGIAIVWESSLVFFAHHLLSGLVTKPGASRALNTALGLMFIGLAVKLAFF